MRIELEPLEIRALGAVVAEELLKSLAPRLDALVSPVIQRALPAPSITPPAPSTDRTAITTLPDILRRHDLRDATGLSPSTISRLESTGDFPARILLSANRVGWRRAEVLDWVARRNSAATR